MDEWIYIISDISHANNVVSNDEFNTPCYKIACMYLI